MSITINKIELTNFINDNLSRKRCNATILNDSPQKNKY